MQRLTRILLGLITALALALGGPGVAGPAKGAMLVSLCADGSESAIWLDADGNPVEPGSGHVKCLDCLVFSAPLPESAVPSAVDFGPSLPRLLALPTQPAQRPIAHLRPDPRGPPMAGIASRHDGNPGAAPLFPGPAVERLDIRQPHLPAPVTDLRASL